MGINKFRNVLLALLVCFVCVYGFAFSAQSVFAVESAKKGEIQEEKKNKGEIQEDKNNKGPVTETDPKNPTIVNPDDSFVPIEPLPLASSDDKNNIYDTPAPTSETLDTGSASISGSGAESGADAFAGLDEPVAGASGTDLSTEQAVKTLGNSLKAAWIKFSPAAADAVFEEDSDQLKPWARTAGLIIIVLIAAGIITSVHRRRKHRVKARKQLITDVPHRKRR